MPTRSIPQERVGTRAFGPLCPPNVLPPLPHRPDFRYNLSVGPG